MNWVCVRIYSYRVAVGVKIGGRGLELRFGVRVRLLWSGKIRVRGQMSRGKCPTFDDVWVVSRLRLPRLRKRLSSAGVLPTSPLTCDDDVVLSASRTPRARGVQIKWRPDVVGLASCVVHNKPSRRPACLPGTVDQSPESTGPRSP